MADIIDAIDALVDEQMAGGEPRTGYDYGNPTYPKCGHCGRHWHGLPITQRIADMYRYGVYDETYSAADDDSRVLCLGSDFIGPMPAERLQHWFPNPYTAGLLPGELTITARTWMPSYREHFAPPDRRRWWRLPQLPAGAEIEERRESRPCLGGTAILHIDTVTLIVGEDCETWGRDMVRYNATRTGVNIDVLTELAPDLGGTWEPLTAPGSTRHPDTPTQPDPEETE